MVFDEFACGSHTVKKNGADEEWLHAAGGGTIQLAWWW